MLPFFIFTLPLLQMGSSLQEEILFIRLSVITFLLQDIVSLFSFPVLLPLLWPNILPLPISSSFYFFAGQVFSFFSFSVFFPLSILSYSEYFSSTPPLTIYFHPFPSPWQGVDFDQVFFSLFTLLIEISCTHLYKNGQISRKCWAVEYWNLFIFLNDEVFFYTSEQTLKLATLG